MLVAGYLSLLVVGILLMVIFPVLRSSRKTSERIEMQQLGMVALNRLTRDCSNVPAVGLTVPSVLANGDIFFCLHGLSGCSVEGQPIWTAQVIVYHWSRSESTIYRTLWPTLPDATKVPITAPYRPTLTEMTNALATGQKRVLARHVEAFGFDTGAPPGIHLPLKVTLRLTGEMNPPLQWENSIFLHNDT